MFDIDSFSFFSFGPVVAPSAAGQLLFIMAIWPFFMKFYGIRDFPYSKFPITVHHLMLLFFHISP